MTFVAINANLLPSARRYVLAHVCKGENYKIIFIYAETLLGLAEFFLPQPGDTGKTLLSPIYI